MADRSTRLDFILRLTDMVTAPLAKVKMGFSELAERGQQNITQMGVGLAGMVGAGVAITEAMQPALEMNRALADVRSLSVAEDALDALNKKALAFSVAYGENAQAFVASAYQVERAIKGLTGSQLATFTHASNVLAKATKADAATMTSYVGTMYNLHKSQADAMGKGAWVNALAGQTALAVQLFRTSGEQIGEAFNAAGGLASTAGVSLAEQMAVLGTAASTMDAGTAGGAYKAFFENVGAASESLGMSFTDSNGRLLPMLDIVEQLKGRFGDLSVAANSNALADAFGGEATMLLTRLMGDTDRLRNGMDKLGQVRGLEAAEQMAKGMVDPWQQFAAAVQALRIAIGQALMPILTPLMERLTGIASTITRWTGLFPNITRAVGLVALAVLGMAGAIGAVTFAVALAKTAWLGLSAVWSIATAAAWLFNAALWANPATWVVIGIIALTASIALAIAYWDEIVEAFASTTVFQWISDQLGAIGSWFDSMGGWAGIASAAWEGITKIFFGYINGLIKLLNKIPGVNIETQFGEIPELPQIPGAGVATNVSDSSASPAILGTAATPELLQASLGITPALEPMPSVPQLPGQDLRIQPMVGAVTAPELPEASLGITSALEPMPAVPQLPDQALRIQPMVGAVAAPELPEASLGITPALDPMPAVPQLPGQDLRIQPMVGAVAAPELPEASLGITPVLEPLPAMPHVLGQDLRIQPVVDLGEAQQLEQAQQPSLSPERPSAVPKGGLLSSIQNTTNNQRQGNHIEKVELHTSQPMSPLAMEHMLSMAVG